MLKSTIVLVENIFVGVAVAERRSDWLSFYAVHPSVKAMHNVVRSDLNSIQAEARLVYRQSRYKSQRDAGDAVTSR